MKVLHVQMKSSGVKQLLRSEAVRQNLEERAERIQKAAGGEEQGFNVYSAIGSRARARVYADGIQARRGEAKDRRLTRAIGAGK